MYNLKPINYHRGIMCKIRRIFTTRKSVLKKNLFLATLRTLSKISIKDGARKWCLRDNFIRTTIDTVLCVKQICHFNLCLSVDVRTLSPEKPNLSCSQRSRTVLCRRYRANYEVQNETAKIVFLLNRLDCITRKRMNNAWIKYSL